MFKAKVPPSQSKYLVVDADTYSALRQIPRFSEYSNAGDAGLRALVDGSVGKLKDFYRLPFAVRAQDRQRASHDA